MNRLMISIAAAVLLLISASGVARADNRKVDEDIKATWASVAAGHTNDAIARAAKLMTEIDPAQDDEGYWRSSSTLVEILQELEADSVADKILGAMAQKKIAETQPSRRVWMQYYVARDLVRLGQKEQGVQILKAVTANDERQVYFPVQRSAAILMSKIEFDAENIEQSAIWMRRAVLGILMNKDAAPADILSVLTEYAAHLALTRRPLDALALYARLQPIYKVGVPKHSPLYIHFAAEYLQTLTTVGSYAAADRALADLKEAVTGVDVLPPSISATLLYEDFYQVARSGLATGENPLSETLTSLSG